MSGTLSDARENAGTCMSLSRPKVWRTDTVMSGRSIVWSLAELMDPQDREVTGFKRRVSLVDDFEPFLGCFIAAIGVGVMLFDQFLVALLERGKSEGQAEVERRQRLFLRRGGARMRLGADRVFVEIEQAEILGAVGKAPCDTVAELPARPVPDHVLAQLGLDLGLVHAGIVIPGGVVAAHVVEAEPVILVQRLARPRRPELAGAGAAGTIARPRQRRRGVVVEAESARVEPYIQHGTGHCDSMGCASGQDKRGQARASHRFATIDTDLASPHGLPMATIDRLRARLTDAFAPVRLDIVDESAHHAGHGGSRSGGETHFRVTIVAAAFAGQNRVARQRVIYGVLADELANQVHALSLTALTPSEAEIQL